MTGNVRIYQRKSRISAGKYAKMLKKAQNISLCDARRSLRRMCEELADKIAREGLFGEDRIYGYSGTDVDFIPEDAVFGGEIEE